MSVHATARLLVGRRIVAVEMNPFDDLDVNGRKLRTCYSPVLVLDNGARVHFVVQELDQGGEYGVDPRYTKNTRKP